jgi:hypothetical protein
MFNPNPAFLLVQKLKSPKGFTLGVMAEIAKKNLFNVPQVLINAERFGLILAPRLKKRIPSKIWEANLQPLGPIFQHLLSNLGPICDPKMLKVGLKFFWP